MNDVVPAAPAPAPGDDDNAIHLGNNADALILQGVRGINAVGYYVDHYVFLANDHTNMFYRPGGAPAAAPLYDQERAGGVAVQDIAVVLLICASVLVLDDMLIDMLHGADNLTLAAVVDSHFTDLMALLLTGLCLAIGAVEWPTPEEDDDNDNNEDGDED